MNKKPYSSTQIVEDMFDAKEANKHKLSTTGRKKISTKTESPGETSYHTVHGKTEDVEKYLKKKDYPKEGFRSYYKPALKEHQKPEWK